LRLIDGTADESKEIAYSLMNEHQIKLFDTSLNVGLAVAIPKLGRFRVSVLRQRVQENFLP
jgi:twitching motility protein PilU